MPKMFSDEQLETLIRRLADGESLSSIGNDPDMPCRDTIMDWEDDPQHRFSASITRARMRGVDARIDRAVQAAKDAKDAALGRLSFDADRWWASKCNPRKYGDAMQLKHADADGGKIDIDPVARASRLASIFAEIEKRNGFSEHAD